MLEYISNTWPEWVCGALIPVVSFLIAQIRATRKGMRALLRADIIRLYNKYHDDLGYCPIYVQQALEDEYKQYHALGGNGVITELHNKLMALPTEPERRKEHV